MQSQKILRITAVLLVSSVAITSGCGWLKGKKNKDYALPAEQRPLEIPPDLDRPTADAALNAPAAGNSVTRSSVQQSMASPESGAGFTVQGSRDQVFEKVGTVLAATPGVTIASKAQLLGSYDVNFEGANFLLRVSDVSGGAYVSAVDPRGVPAQGAAPVKLLNALKAGLQ